MKLPRVQLPRLALPRLRLPTDPAERATLIAAVATGCVCFLISWIGAAPSSLLGLHWDTGSFMARMATSTHRWGHAGVPWTSHLALPQIYIVACAIVQLVGGSCFDGFRILQSLCVGAGGVLFFATAARLARSTTLGALYAVAFATAWGTFALIFSMVDNLVYLPLVMAVLYVCVRRLDAWRDRDSALVGALAGVAALVSLQCVIYLIPPLFAITFLGGSRRLVVRARQLAVVIALFVAVIVAWGLVLGVTTSASVRQVFGVMTERPQATYVPKNEKELRALFDMKAFFHHLGMGVAQELTIEMNAEPLYNGMKSVGVWLLGAELVLLVAALVAYWRKRAQAGLVFVAFTLLALTFVTSLYHDLIFEKYKRYEFLPLLIFLTVAALVGCAQRRHRLLARVAMVAAIVVIGVQTANGVANNREWHEKLPFFPRGLNDYYGRDKLSWIGYFRKLQRLQPTACRFVFYIDEFPGIRWNHEVTAGMATQLPAYAIVGWPMEIFKWKYKPALLTPPATGQLRDCDVISPRARLALHLP